MKKYIAFVLLIFLSCASRANTCPADKPVLWLDGVCITCLEAAKKFDEMGSIHSKDIELFGRFVNLLKNLESSCGATIE